MQRFTDIEVWNRSHALALRVYAVTRSFPDEERFGVVAQYRRAATSVPANIAEGSKRISRADYARIFNIAEGSLAETEYLTMLARDLAYLAVEPARELLTEIAGVARMLAALRRTVAGRAR